MSESLMKAMETLVNRFGREPVTASYTVADVLRAVGEAAAEQMDRADAAETRASRAEDAALRASKRVAAKEEDAKRIRLPEGSIAIGPADDASVIVLRGLSDDAREVLRSTVQSHVAASSDPALAPPDHLVGTRLREEWPQWGSAGLARVGEGGMLDSDVVEKAGGIGSLSRVFGELLVGRSGGKVRLT